MTTPIDPGDPFTLSPSTPSSTPARALRTRPSAYAPWIAVFACIA